MPTPQRILFVLPPFAGHVVPATTVGSELIRRGHEVTWATYPAVEGLLPPAGERLLFSSRFGVEDFMRAREASGGRWMAGLKAFWTDVMVPLAQEMLPQVERAIAETRPDVVVADQQAIAGALAARRAGVPWVTSAATFAWASEVQSFPAIQAWVDAQLEGLQRDAGLDVIDEPDLARELVLAYTTEELAGCHRRGLPFHYVGAPVDGREERGEFPWELLDERKKVLVSLGTVSHYRGVEFLRKVAEALDESLQVIVAAPDGLLAEAPANFIVRPWVPQLAVLRRVDLLVCNAGFSSTGEALAMGVPVVAAPIAYDSSIVAERIVAAGAGERVRFYRCTASELGETVQRVLDDPSYVRAARALADANRRAGGAGAAADAIESMFLRAGRDQG